MPRPTEQGRTYLAGLDGLRALSVLAVIAYHLDLGFAPGGLLGVDVFFVLSGYLITDLLVAEWDRRGRIDLGRFWLRRARRLLPALLLMLAAVVLFVAVWDPLLLDQLRGDLLAALLYVSNWWFIFHRVSYFARFGPPSPLGHLWSLAVEEQFYLVWPPLLALGLRFVRRRSWLAVASLGLAALSLAAMAALFHPGHDPTRVYDGTDTRAFALLIGAAAALLVPSARLRAVVGRPLRTLEAAGIVGLVAVVGFFVGTTEMAPFLYRGGMGLLSLATAVLVVALACPGTRLGRLLGVAPLRWLGVRSYGVYLWHYPIIVFAAAIVPHLAMGLRAALAVAVSVSLAALSWRFVEDPLRRGGLGGVLEGVRRQHGRWWRVPGGARLFGYGAAGCFTLAVCLAALTDALPGSQPILTKVLPTRPALAESARRGGGRVRQALPAGEGVSAIGDSVLIDATPYLADLLPGIVIDGYVGRQMVEAPAVIAYLASEHELGPRVLVLELGTNGPFPEGLLLHMLRTLPVRRVVLVNTRVPRPWQAEVNAELALAVRRLPYVSLVNWYAASRGHAGWFYPDGVHLNPTGAEAYARLVARAVRQAEASLDAPTARRPRRQGGRRAGTGATTAPAWPSPARVAPEKPPTTSDAEVGLPHVGRLGEGGGAALPHHPAGVHDVEALAAGER